MLPERQMSDLSAAYDLLTRGWTHEQLADRYGEAKCRGELLAECDEHHQIRRPVAMLATAVPVCATLNVAIHVIHVMPATVDPCLVDQLFDNAEMNSAITLHRCHLALELDGRAHDYTADEWRPAVYDTATSLLESASLDRQPPSVVEHAQEAVRWLSRAIVEFDRDSAEPAAAVADTLGRVLALHIFADGVRKSAEGAGA
jgi:hypothetical protein